ncbi:MFS general substrate transporter [Melanomma pulvis-pyrius CBS 109.77]|uniref:MFS general substrate transporter n=1 Tax=Melanomma pulvis-pyrius CBS 109.77 TaxID=1314802 RepID=A0A6A6X9S8_9PLEO|nr:MFS general substrate transporter [Melanomma pulvis-pyrius CBS 109.77]
MIPADVKPAPSPSRDPEKGEAVANDDIGDAGHTTVDPTPIDAEVEKRVLRKLDRRLVSLVFVLYLLAYLDRSNIGNAKIAGLDKDLSLSSSQYQWLLTIFYISYILFEWFALMWKLVPPHIWATFCVLGWGVTATLQAATFSFSGMMAARFFLGFFEAGYGPGIPYLLSFFYLRHEVGFRSGIFLSAAPLATCFAGALAYGITSNDSPPIANWRLLFLVEGLPTIVAAAAAWFLMPDSPEKASFLTDEEKMVARARALRQVGAEDAHRVGHVDFKDIGHALLDLKNYFTAFMYFSCNVSFSSLPVFLPTILSEMGFTPLTSQGLSAPPYFIAFLLVITTTYIADRTQQRGLTIVILSAVGAIGYIMLATTSSTGPRYAGVYLAAAGVFPSIGNILPWVLNNQGSDTKRGAGIAILNLIGQCGPLLGTRVYPARDGPYYRKGMWVCAAFMLFNGCLAAGLRALLVWENRRLDREFGPVEHKGDGGAVGLENDGPAFRYVL